MSLTRYEKETIILFNDAEDAAEVYTCNSALMRRLDELSQNNALVDLTKENKNSKTYNLPKKWVKIQKPRQLTEEMKQKRADIAKAVLHKSQGVMNYAR